MRQRIDLVFPVLPPVIDGIGDHTACFSRALSEQSDVRIWVSQGNYHPIAGVDVRPAYSLERPSGIKSLLPSIEADPPDWLILQFNQFSYGRWGFNPYVPLVVREMKRRIPSMRVAWVAHEDFVPVSSAKFAVMTTWQRWQFWMLGRHADVVFFSIDPWVQKYRAWFPRVPVEHLPIGSTMPRVAVDRRQARRRLGLDEATFVAGVFGTVNPSRMLPLIREASLALQERAPEFRLLYVGPHGKAMKDEMRGVHLLDAGILEPEDVSVHLAAMDVHLAPFIDGVSTRRTSFMAGLQHGLPTVGTAGPLTDAVLHRRNGQAFLLAPVDDAAAFERHAISLFEDASLRARIGSSARSLYDSSFSFAASTRQFLKVIGEA